MTGRSQQTSQIVRIVQRFLSAFLSANTQNCPAFKSSQENSMRILLLVLTLSLSAFTHHAFSADITMDECNTRVAEMNATLPMALDDITTWISTTCVDQGNDAIQLVYVNHVKDGNAITQTELDAVRPSVLMSWCFGPDLFPL